MSNPTTATPPADTTQQQQTPPAAVGFTAEDIATAVAAGISAHTAQTTSTPREMTPEERAEYFQIFDPNADGFLDSFVAAVTDAEATPEVRAKAIEHLRDGIANQSIRGAQVYVDQRFQQMEARFAPVLRTSVEAEAEVLWGKFATAHPDLKDHRELVNAVSTQLQAAGVKPKDMTEAFNSVAETARGIVTKITGKPPTTPATTQTGPTTMPRMTQTNTAQSSAAPGQPQAPQTGVASFFTKRKR